MPPTNIASTSAIYDEFRDADLNREYYGRRIRRARRQLRNLDIFLALFAGGSGIAGFAFWDVALFGIQIGQIALGLLFGIATMFAVAKPYLKLEDELERLSGIQTTYEALSHALGDVVIDIKAHKEIREPTYAVYQALRQIRGSLGPKEDRAPDRIIIEEVQAAVRKRHPESWFWYPAKKMTKKDEAGSRE